MKFLTEREFHLCRLKHVDLMPNYKTTEQHTGPEGKRPFGRFRRRWKDNINMVLKKSLGWHRLE